MVKRISKNIKLKCTNNLSGVSNFLKCSLKVLKVFFVKRQVPQPHDLTYPTIIHVTVDYSKFLKWCSIRVCDKDIFGYLFYFLNLIQYIKNWWNFPILMFKWNRNFTFWWFDPPFGQKWSKMAKKVFIFSFFYFFHFFSAQSLFCFSWFHS